MRKGEKQGLPADEQKTESEKRKVTLIPASKSMVRMDLQLFATIVCLIPPGKLSSVEAICEMWAKRKGRDFCELERGVLPYGKSLFFSPADVAKIETAKEVLSRPEGDKTDFIPYWRLVSVRGYLIDFGYAGLWTKERQKEILEREGHTIEKLNNGNRSYRVVGYKEKMMDLNGLIIKE